MENSNGVITKAKFIDTQIFIERAKKIHGEKYDYSLTEYKDMRTTRLKIICPKHGIFESLAGNHLKGSGCKECAVEKRKGIKVEKFKPLNVEKKGTSLTQEQAIQRFKHIHGDKYDYSLVVYKKYNTPIRIICPDHGEFELLPNSHWKGSGCPKCLNIGEKLNTEKVVNLLTEQFGNKFDYSQIKYTGWYDKIKIICSEHGIMEKTFDFFKRRKQLCTLCEKNKVVNINKDIILEKLQYNPNKYIFLNIDEYVNVNSLLKFICPKHGEVDRTYNNYFKNYSCPKCSLSQSSAELEILNFILEIDNDSKPFHNSRKFIPPLEIDILCKKYKFAIEFNGDAFHSFGKSESSMLNNYMNIDKCKHQIKTNLVEKKEYQLFHIVENHWKNPTKKEIWKSIIRNKMNKGNRIFARKCKIVDLSNSRLFIKSFLENNHLQGHNNSFSVAIGLEYNNTIYSIMTFSKVIEDNQNLKKFDYKLTRFCTLKDYNIIGGASKLLKFFENNYNPKSLLSYAKRDWSKGNVYEKLGFIHTHNTDPSIFFYDKNYNRYSREKFQKHKLQKLYNQGLLTTLEGNSVLDIMFNNNYRIYYDAGNRVYVKKYEKENYEFTVS